MPRFRTFRARIPGVSPVDGFAFGPYRLNLRTKHLLRGDEPVELPVRQFELLVALATHAGRVLSKNELINAAWGDVAVSDNSLAQGVSQLRAALHDDAGEYIETIRRHGYRFLASVAPIELTTTDLDLEPMLSQHRVFMDGRAALETLARDRIAAAREMFTRLVRQHPNEAGYRVGLATACGLWAESTRADPEPDRAAMAEALVHAKDACRLKPDHAEAWATLAFALARSGRAADALAAHARAIALDPSNWRVLFRCSYDSWGEERVSKARQALAQMPELVMARWVIAVVYVARGALVEAERHVDAGLAELQKQAASTARFAVLGLHWLKAFFLIHRRDYDEALAACRDELALEGNGHLYAREMAANTWYLIGAVHLLRGERDEARDAFRESLARVPAHPLACAGLAIIDGSDLPFPCAPGAPFEHVVAHACVHVWRGDVNSAAALVSEALAAAPPGSAGWRLPLEPLLRVDDTPDAWATVLATVRQRAM